PRPRGAAGARLAAGAAVAGRHAGALPRLRGGLARRVLVREGRLRRHPQRLVQRPLGLLPRRRAPGRPAVDRVRGGAARGRGRVRRTRHGRGGGGDDRDPRRLPAPRARRARAGPRVLRRRAAAGRDAGGERATGPRDAMRIALIADEDPGWGGIGTYTGVLGEALGALGHEVHLVLRGRED